MGGVGADSDPNERGDSVLSVLSGATDQRRLTLVADLEDSVGGGGSFDAGGGGGGLESRLCGNGRVIAGAGAAGSVREPLLSP